MLEVFLLVVEIGFCHLLIKSHLQFLWRADTTPLNKKIVIGFCLLPQENGVVEVSAVRRAFSLARKSKLACSSLALQNIQKKMQKYKFS